MNTRAARKLEATMPSNNKRMQLCLESLANITIATKLEQEAIKISEKYGDNSVIVIAKHRLDEYMRIGTYGLSGNELREALCAAVHHSYELPA